MMATAPRVGFVLGGLLVVASGAWFGSLVYFDTLAAPFIGCFI
jgi:hypothetical protein